MWLFFIQKLSWSHFSSIQNGKDEYKQAPTSDGEDKKGEKDKEKKKMDNLKKEVDLVSQKKASETCR